MSNLDEYQIGKQTYIDRQEYFILSGGLDFPNRQ